MMAGSKMHKSDRRNLAGFTLIEVLVALVILSLGILGVVALQAASLRNTTASSQRSIAINLASDISDRMRANPAGLMLGDYIYANYSGTSVTGVATADCASTTGCGSQALAQNDISEWNAAIMSMLPQVPAAGTVPAGVVCVDSTPDDGTPDTPACDDKVLVGTSATEIDRPNYKGRLPYVIKIWWAENRNVPSTSALMRLSVRFEP